MANPNPISNESKSPYVCVYGVSQAHPDLGDSTKYLDARCIHLLPGSTVHLSDRDAAHLMKQGAVRKQ